MKSKRWLAINTAVAIVVCSYTGAGAADTPMDSEACSAQSFDLVLRGGRVMDPESGLNALRNVGIKGGKVVAVSEDALNACEELDVTGLVVAPGFIDLHAHGQDNKSNRLQARDGVTTALDLEAGSYPLDDLYATRDNHALLNYGVSVGHIPARVKVLTGLSVGHPLTREIYAAWYERWLGRVIGWFIDPIASTREPLNPGQLDELVERLSEELDRGALGVGFALDYVPGTSDEELTRLFALAAARDVPCFVHMKGVTRPEDMSAMRQILDLIEKTKAAVHIMHITSTGQARTPRYLEMIDEARGRGHDITTEMYPYTAASTLIETAFFDEGFRQRLGIDYTDLQWVATGERLTEESFHRYRKQGGYIVIHMMDEETVRNAMAHPLVMIASDGLPMVSGGEHPRGAGTYARILGRYVREEKHLELMSALAKMTLMPAQRLEGFVPQMRNKGRISVGTDADITVFDPESVIDQATYENSHQASVGIPYVLVGGRFVVREGSLADNTFPGRPIRADGR